MTAERKYYAAENRYGSQTSRGFSNTWYVLVFDSRAARDAWVNSQDTLTAKAITRREVTKYSSNWDMTDNRMSAPRPFTDEFWGIMPPFCFDDETPGFIGTIAVCSPDDFSIGRLYS